MGDPVIVAATFGAVPVGLDRFSVIVQVPCASGVTLAEPLPAVAPSPKLNEPPPEQMFAGDTVTLALYAPASDEPLRVTLYELAEPTVSDVAPLRVNWPPAVCPLGGAEAGGVQLIVNDPEGVIDGKLQLNDCAKALVEKATARTKHVANVRRRRFCVDLVMLRVPFSAGNRP